MSHFVELVRGDRVQSNSVTGWLHSLRDGDEAAAEKVWERFFHRLVTAAARQLRRGVNRVADEEDVAVDVFDSFCRRIQTGAYPNLSDRDELWRLLLTITENKARNQIRHERAQKRGAGGVRGDSVFYARAESANAPGFDRFSSIDPTPEDVAIMDETMTELLDRLTDEQREISIQKLQGYSNREISMNVALSVATVERRLRQIRTQWSDLVPDEESAE